MDLITRAQEAFSRVLNQYLDGKSVKKAHLTDLYEVSMDNCRKYIDSGVDYFKNKLEDLQGEYTDILYDYNNSDEIPRDEARRFLRVVY